MPVHICMLKERVFYSFRYVIAYKNRVTVQCLKLRNSFFDILRCLRYTLNLYSFSLFYSWAFQLIKSGIKYNGLCFTGKVHNFNIIAYRQNIRMLQRENVLLSIFRKMVLNKKNNEYHQLYGISEISTVNVMNSMVPTIDGPGFIFIWLCFCKITFGFGDTFVYRHGCWPKEIFLSGF